MFLLIFISKVYGSCISSIGNLMADTLTDPKLELAKLAPYIYFSGKGYKYLFILGLMILDYMKIVQINTNML